ncbi:MAG: formyltetrahydrofolate deformylase [Omnitrophica WOR_2 bacterium RIFCSPHIGHO2_02_FULL_48_11]|nr:MAG: formyltetrahydrofolate deformylase [Omnitrophica WOR_2 bacterium RIFCSPHIGHO2_02_FULL_48_11]
MKRAILLISCPDQKGITASIANFIYKNNGNIVHADQHIDEQADTFFMRAEWDLTGFKVSPDDISKKFQPFAKKFRMKWNLYFSKQRPRVAVFVSRQLHCLQDILLRQRAGQLACDIPLIVSNHPAAKALAHDFGLHFFEFPITPANKRAQEKRELEVLRAAKINLVVLARYHQILTADFVRHYPNEIINIHHSFLPAFAGSNPYRQAYQKGVKIIGATSHYVTARLDEGPIIEQDTVRVSHRDSLEDLMRKGEDLEKIVLSRAVRWHLERKILAYNNKTVVFD